MDISFGCIDSPYLGDYVINKVEFVFSPIDKGRYNKKEQYDA